MSYTKYVGTLKMSLYCFSVSTIKTLIVFIKVQYWNDSKLYLKEYCSNVPYEIHLSSVRYYTTRGFELISELTTKNYNYTQDLFIHFLNENCIFNSYSVSQPPSVTYARNDFFVQYKIIKTVIT